jgi:general secretion pathway protein N
MTMLSTTRARILVGFALLAALVLFLPLRLAAGLIGFGDLGLTARSAGGTVWSGRLEQARLGGFDLGTLDVGLKPLPLLLGRASMAIERPVADGAPPLAGTVSVGIGRRAVEGLSGTISGGDIGSLPIESIAFDSATIVFADGRCVEASGRVTLTVGLSIAGLQLRNGMTGGLNCEGRDLVTTLVGQSGLERLRLTIDPQGNYVARLLVQSTDPVLGAALTTAGFGPTAEGYVRTARGRL